MRRNKGIERWSEREKEKEGNIEKHTWGERYRNEGKIQQRQA